MSEQFGFNFEKSLPELYREQVGVSPRRGRDSEGHLRWAIGHPEEERAELQRIDLEEDQEARRRRDV